jgi:uncharacterized protein involved in exopolysaccharide biosynthesis
MYITQPNPSFVPFLFLSPWWWWWRRRWWLVPFVVVVIAIQFAGKRRSSSFVTYNF